MDESGVASELRDVTCTDLLENAVALGFGGVPCGDHRCGERMGFPLPSEAQGRVLSWKVDAFYACRFIGNGDVFEFGDIQSTDLVEIYLSVRWRGRVCGQ